MGANEKWQGRIPRILQIYLRALCELAGNERAVQLLALNDSQMDSRDLRRCCLDHELEQWRESAVTTMIVSGPPSQLGAIADIVLG